MNFLSNFYFDRESDNCYHILGTKGIVSIFLLHMILFEETYEVGAKHRGCKRRECHYKKCQKLSYKSARSSVWGIPEAKSQVAYKLDCAENSHPERNRNHMVPSSVSIAG